MNNLQKTGGATALIHSAAYLVGIAMYFAILSPIIDATPVQYVAQLAKYHTLMYIWIFIAYWVAGFCLIVVTLALYERLKADSPVVMQIATILGIIWASLIIGSGNLMLHGFGEVAKLHAIDPAQAEMAYMTLKIVENGIVSGNELIGGLWVFLLSWVALRTSKLPKSLNYFGLVIGVAGIVSIAPPLTEAAVIIFGLSMIVWFAWTGIVLLRNHPSASK